MAMEAEDILKLLMPGLSSGQSRSWQQYGPAGQQQATVIQYLRKQIQSAMSSLGLLGSLAAPFVSDFLVGRDFDKFGRPISQLSGVLAPQGQSYAGAYQTMLRSQQTAALGITQKQFQDEIWQQSARAYYGVTDPSLKGQELKNKIKGSNFLAPQRIINYFLDPMQREKALKGVRDTMAGSLYWDNRRGVQPTQAVENARQYGRAAKQLVIEANETMLGARRRGRTGQLLQGQEAQIFTTDAQGKKRAFTKGKDFGGFKGSQIAQLASIIANTSDNIPGLALEQAVAKFKQKVEQTARAISPLKDIFGNNVKAMTDALQAISGQRITQMPEHLARSLATSITDMSRYANVSPAQIQAMSSNLLATATSKQYGDSFSRAGTAKLGTMAAALTANGNAPAGIYVGEYVGDVNQRLAQLNNTKGADWLAKAYAIWKEGKPEGTLQQFQEQVTNKRAQGKDLIRAAIDVAGVTYLPQLNRGSTLTAYRQAKVSGKMGQMALQGQFQQAIINQSFRAANQVGTARAAQGRRLFTNMEGQDLKYLMQHHLQDNAVQHIVDKYNARGFNVDTATLGAYLKNPQFIKTMQATATARQARQFSIRQQGIRTKMAAFQKASGGSWNTLFRAISQPDARKYLQTMPGVAAQDMRALQRDIVNAKTDSQARTRVKNLNESLGIDLAAQATQKLYTSRASDASYKEAFTNVYLYKNSTKAEQQALYQQGLRYIQASEIVDLSKSKSIQQLISDDAYKEDVNKILASVKDKKGSARVEAIVQAQKDFRKLGIQRRIKTAEASVLGLSQNRQVAKTQRETLSANLSKDIQVLKNSTDAKTWAGFESKQKMLQSYRRAQSGFDAKSDIQARILTVLEKLLDWLKKQFPDM